MKQTFTDNFIDMLSVFSDGAVTVVNGSNTAQGFVTGDIAADLGRALDEESSGECTVLTDEIGELANQRAVTVGGRPASVLSQRLDQLGALTVFRFRYISPASETVEEL